MIDKSDPYIREMYDKFYFMKYKREGKGFTEFYFTVNGRIRGIITTIVNAIEMWYSSEFFDHLDMDNIVKNHIKKYNKIISKKA